MASGRPVLSRITIMQNHDLSDGRQPQYSAAGHHFVPDAAPPGCRIFATLHASMRVYAFACRSHAIPAACHSSRDADGPRSADTLAGERRDRQRSANARAARA